MSRFVHVHMYVLAPCVVGMLGVVAILLFCLYGLMRVLGMIFLVCRYCMYTYRYMWMYMYTHRYRYRYRYVHK